MRDRKPPEDLTVRFAPWASQLPVRLHLRAREIHLWAWEADRAAHDVACLTRLLSPDELDRAARFREARDQTRFVAARGIMRGLLGRYCGRPADALRFIYGAHGKPALVGPGPQFSVSRRDSLSVMAVSESAAVGVDIERRVQLPDAAAILREYASAAEILAYMRLPAEDRDQSFYCWWTRKEAVVKAHGGGLSIPLNGFDVPMEVQPTGTNGSLVRGPGGVWTLRHLCPREDYLGALAMEHSSPTLKAWYFRGDWLRQKGAEPHKRQD